MWKGMQRAYAAVRNQAAAEAQGLAEQVRAQQGRACIRGFWSTAQSASPDAMGRLRKASAAASLTNAAANADHSAALPAETSTFRVRSVILI